MSRQQVLLLGIAVILIALFLVGCGGSAPITVSEAPAATSAPEQAVATPTPEPPTATPTPAVVNPQAGAAFSGDLESSAATSSGTINFKVSDDGNSITDVEVTVTGGPLKPVKCSGGSLESVGELTQNLDGPFAVKEGNIDGEELKGKFISPTEANGTINIVVEFSIFSNSITCDFGT